MTINLCINCGSDEVFFDAYVGVNDPTDVRTFDAVFCADCEGLTTLVDEPEQEDCETITGLTTVTVNGKDPMIPTFDQGGRTYPVPGDEFYIDPGISVQVVPDADVELIHGDGTRITTVTGTNFYLVGVDTDLPVLYRVVAVRYPTLSKES